MKKILTSFALIVAAGMILSAQNIPQAAKDKAADLVSKMTLEEKVSMLSGYEDGFHTFPVERLGIPSIRMAELLPPLHSIERRSIIWERVSGRMPAQGESESCSDLE